MNHPIHFVNSAPASARSALVEALARVILMRERLTPEALPRCRREVLLQLRASRARFARVCAGGQHSDPSSPLP